MDQAKFDSLARRKAVAVSEHLTTVARSRQILANLILTNPPRARRHAERTLERKTAPQQQWSRNAWTDLLRSTAPATWAQTLVDPPKGSEALADSHPFGGLNAKPDGD